MANLDNFCIQGNDGTILAGPFSQYSDVERWLILRGVANPNIILDGLRARIISGFAGKKD